MTNFMQTGYYQDCYYHIYNRGVAKAPIFRDDQDYKNFLYRLKILLGIIPIPVRTRNNSIRLSPLPQNSFDLLTYCLMPNHFHFFFYQKTPVSLSALMHRLCTSYTKYFNKKYDRVGPLFQSEFKDRLISNEAHFTYLSAYIHNNPIDPISYEYSSIHNYLGTVNDQLVNTVNILNIFKGDRTKYRKFVLSFNKSDERRLGDLKID